MNKQGLINHILTNGRTKTWLELANEFEIGEGLTNEQKSKKANDIYRSYLKKENLQLEDFTKGSKVKGIKKWQLPDGSWRQSISFENTQSKVDLEDFRKNLIKDIAEYEYPEFKPKNIVFNEIAALINISDAHLNKLTLVSETGLMPRCPNVGNCPGIILTPLCGKVGGTDGVINVDCGNSFIIP